MAGETVTRTGSRKVELFVPIKRAGKTLDVIEIASAKLDHVVRWGEGKIKGSLALLVELSGLDEGTLRELTYPDADRVLSAFMASLPPSIRNDIDNGVHPLATQESAPSASPVPWPGDADMTDAATVGAGPGFDLGER